MLNMKNIIILSLACLVLVSCGQKQNASVPHDKTEKDAELPELKTTIFNVAGKSDLYTEPSETSSRIINPKTTELMGHPDYYSIDASCTVEVTDSVDGWYKVRVKEPYWLRDTHCGWVKKEVLETSDKAELNLRENIDYHFLKRNKKGNMNNLYFSYYLKFDEPSLLKVAKFFKQRHCPDEECNIYIYDTKDLMDIIDKYPLTDEEYLKVADHFIYSYDFSDSGQFYPFQDIKYKELGGKNWKKSPLK